MLPLIIAGGVIVLALFIIIIIYISTQKKLRAEIADLDQKDQSLAQACLKRYDIFAKIYEQTKGYLSQNDEPVKEFANLMTIIKTVKPSEYGRIVDKINALQAKLVALAEVHQELVENKDYQTNKKISKELDDKYQAQRKSFNSAAQDFNGHISGGFGKLVAKGMQVGARPLYQGESKPLGKPAVKKQHKQLNKKRQTSPCSGLGEVFSFFSCFVLV
ncbi:MAG: hypothetical protein EZS28_048299 [Streblomastix strix]|uniref:LemA family protein n=1 Tax=Streblomastix strix TaxID=222440 RepID=A0A5J4TEG8_9EUKA|nr:MAG: hypothetical protein EZS28_048299 [Streblomastix strix]